MMRLNLPPAPRSGNIVEGISTTATSGTLVTVAANEHLVLTGLWYSNPTDTDSVVSLNREGVDEDKFQVSVPAGLGWNWNLTQMEWVLENGQNLEFSQSVEQQLYIGFSYFIVRKEYVP